MREIEILEVRELDPAFRSYRIEGNVPYVVRYAAEDGLLYWERVWASDELGAVMQVMTGNYSDLNMRMKEQTNDGHSRPQAEAGED